MLPPISGTEIFGLLLNVFVLAILFLTTIIAVVLAALTRYTMMTSYAFYAAAMVSVIFFVSGINEIAFPYFSTYSPYFSAASHHLGAVAVTWYSYEFYGQSTLVRRNARNLNLAITGVGLLVSLVSAQWGEKLIVVSGLTTVLFIATGMNVIWRERKVSNILYLYSLCVLMVMVVIYCLRLADVVVVPGIAGFELQIGSAIEVIGNFAAVLLRYSEVWRSRQKENEQLREKLHQSTKVEALGVLAAGIAHEINNPLGSIRLAASNLKKLLENHENPYVHKFLHDINQMVDRQARIVRSMMVLRQPSTNVQMQRMKLVELIDDAVVLVQPTVRKHNIIFEVTENRSNFILADQTMASQCFIIVLTNAIDAVRREQNPKVRISFRILEKTIDVLISNNGPRIDKPILERIFDPFFTTKPIGEGSGLGLSIARQLMQAQKGSIWYDTEAQETCFVLTFQNAP